MAKVMYNVPNLLSAYRIIVVPVIALCLYLDNLYVSKFAVWVAVWLFFFACWSDWLDGVIARKYGQISTIGKFLDSSADKILVGGVMLLLVAYGRLTGLWVFAALIIFVREILIAGLREFLAMRQIDVPISWLGKWKAAVQMLASGFLMPGFYGETVVHNSMEIGRALFFVATVMTVVSGWDYLKKGYETMVTMEDGK
jgi:cardiolipin synthase